MRTPSVLRSCRPTSNLLLAVLLGSCGGGDVSLPPDGQPASITVVEGDAQSGRVGEPLAEALVVQVTDSRGRPVDGATVAFEFGSAGPGASVVPETKPTNGDGLADARLVLGTTIGRQSGRAVVVSTSATSIETPFSATALSENANSMAAAAGQDQTGHVSQPLDDRLVVEVRDGFGNPVAGVPITWTAVGGGSISEPVVPTDQDGRSRVERILGPTVGPQSTEATSEGLAGSPVVFLHTAVAGDASRLTVVSGNDQTAVAGTLLPEALVARLVDSLGNGVPNTAVTWVAATGGGSPNPQNTTTDADGRTSTQWTLGAPLGEQRLDAVVSGVGVASFRATAVSAAPPSLVIRTQPAGSAGNGVRLSQQPVVQLRDGAGNDVATAGVQVIAELGGGGELEGTTRQNTDAFGRASFSDLAITGAPGPRTLVFRAAGYAQVTSARIDLQAIGTTTTITADSPDPSGVGTPFIVEFRVTSLGPTPTGSVTVSDGVQSCRGTLTNGAGSCQLTLTSAGNRTLTATYSGLPGLSGSSATEGHTVAAAPPPPNQAPTAEFTFGCTELRCEFDDQSSDSDGRVTTRLWDFGDGTTSTQENPRHDYATGGTYQVTLTVTDDDGATDPVTHPVTVQGPPPPPPNQAPTAEFTFGCTELRCEFDDQSSDSDGRVTTRLWDFGDGTTSTQENPRHDYATGGTYQVTLTVTDDDGATSSITHPVTVQAPPPQPASTTTEITSDTPDPSVSGSTVTVSFSVTSGGGTPTGSVTVGDGTSSCTGILSSGSGSCELALSTVGDRTLTASYSGAEGFSSSTDSEGHQVIAPPPAGTSTSFTSDDPDPTEVGQSFTVAVSVSSNGGTPEGIVTVSDGFQSCSAQLSGGSASCSLALTTSGTRTLTAIYAGNSIFAGSSATETHTVNPPAPTSTSTTISSDTPDPSIEGDLIVVNFAVTSAAGLPEGAVEVTDANGGSCSAPVAVGSCSLAPVGIGSRTLTATYLGSPDFAPSSDSDDHTVNQANTGPVATIASPITGPE